MAKMYFNQAVVGFNGNEYITDVLEMVDDPEEHPFPWFCLDCDHRETNDGPIDVGVTKDGQLVMREQYAGPFPPKREILERIMTAKWYEARVFFKL